MPQHHAITIRFLRKGPNGFARVNPATDDTLQISKLGENVVRCIYTEKSGDGVVIDTSQQSYHQLMMYLQRIFYLLAIDEDPFASVQFFLPGYPTILIEVATLNRNMSALMEVVLSTCMAWPAVGRIAPRTPAEPPAPGVEPLSPPSPPPSPPPDSPV